MIGENSNLVWLKVGSQFADNNYQGDYEIFDLEHLSLYIMKHLANVENWILNLILLSDQDWADACAGDLDV